MLIYSTMIYILNVAIFHGYLRLPKGTGNVQGNWLLFGTWLTLISVNVSYGAHKNKVVATVVIFCWHTQSTIKYKAQQTVPASKSSEALSPLLQCLMPSKPWWLGGNNIDLGLLGIWKLVSFGQATWIRASESCAPFPPMPNCWPPKKYVQRCQDLKDIKNTISSGQTWPNKTFKT